MKIPESKIAEVAAAADIVQVISQYVDLKKAGKDYRGLCPFHGDTDPSFYVSPQKGIFHCFGCAVGGSVFNFLMKMENMSFVEAVRVLASRYGVPFQFESGTAKSRDERDRLGEALTAALEHFQENLVSSAQARDYLSERGVGEEWIDRIGFGFAQDSWDALYQRLAAAGVSPRDAVAAGLIRKKMGGGYYDYFRSRIMIPIRDINGNLVAFGGRILGEGEPKYLNSPESELFRKRSVLFGLDGAKAAVRREGFFLVVEGYFDQLSLRIHGVENAVAPLGTALGPEQVRMMKRFSSEVVTVFDGDDAGIRAVKRSIPTFLAEGVEPRCVILTEDKDPDEAIRRLGVDGFRRLVNSSVSMIDFLLDSLASQYDLNSLQGRNLALEECLPVLRRIADSRERDYFIERCSSRIRVREERIRRLVFCSNNAGGGVAKPLQNRTLFDFPADERNVVRGMLLREGFIDRVIERGALKEMEDPVLLSLGRMMVAFREQHGGFDPRTFCHSLEDDTLASLVAGWLKPRPEEDDLRPEVDGDRVIDQSLDCITHRRITRRKAEIQERLKKCSPDSLEFTELAQELWAIGQRLYK
jgi:DNA primase